MEKSQEIASRHTKTSCTTRAIHTGKNHAAQVESRPTEAALDVRDSDFLLFHIFCDDLPLFGLQGFNQRYRWRYTYAMPSHFCCVFFLQFSLLSYLGF